MSRVVDAVFKVTDQFSGPLRNFNTALTDVGRQGNAARKQIANVGNSIAGVGKTLTASVTIPLTAAGTAAVLYAGEVSKSMELARATAGATAEEWVVAEQAAMDAAKAHTFTMEDASTAALNFARQGFKAEDMTYLMANAMDYAQGTGASLEETSSALGNIMKGFSLEMEDATTVANQLAKAQSLANTNGSELLAGVQAMAPQMKTLGYDTADAATLIAVWGDAGISASEAATAWNASVARMAAPTKQAETWMNRLNFEMFDEEGKAKDLVQVQQELHAAFAELNDQEREQAASAIFGKNQMSKMLMLIDTAPDKFSSLEESIRDSDGVSKSLSDTMMGSLGGSIESLKSSLDVLKYSLGDMIGEYVQPIIEKITSWVDKLNELDDAHKEQIIRWAGIAAAVGPVLIIFGKLIVGASKIMGAFAKIHKAGGILKAGMAAFSAPAAVVIAIIGAIIAVIAVIITHIDEVKASIAKLKENCAPHLENLQAAFENLKTALEPVWTFIKDTFVDAVLGAVDTVCGSEAIPAIIDIFAALVNAVAEGIPQVIQFFGNVKDTIMTVVDAISPYLETIKTNVTEAFGGVVDAIGPFIESVTNFWDNTLKPFVTYVGDTFVNGILNAFDALKNGEGIGQFFDGIGTMITGLLDAIQGIITFLTGVFSGDWSTAWEGIKTTFNGVYEFFCGAFETIVGWLTSIGEALDGFFGATDPVSDAVAKTQGMTVQEAINAGYIGNAAGTQNWRGGPTRVNESGGEIMNLPSGTQIIPHDASLNAAANSRGDITVAKLADTIVVREDADIDRITDSLVRKLYKAGNNMGAYSMA